MDVKMNRCGKLPDTYISKFFRTVCHWNWSRNASRTASFPVVLGDFGCDVTRQACRGSSPSYRTRFQASSGHSDSARWPGYEVTSRNCFCDRYWGRARQLLANFPPVSIVTAQKSLLSFSFLKCWMGSWNNLILIIVLFARGWPSKRSNCSRNGA